MKSMFANLANRRLIFIITSAFIILIVSLNGCKKSDSNAIKEEKPQVFKDIPMDQVPRWAMEESRKAGKGYNVKINQSYPLFIGDAEGNKITSATGREMLQCVDPFDPEYLGNESVLTDIDIMYDCDPTLDLVVKLVLHWKVSTSVSILGANPNNPSQLSRGRLRLKNSSGVYHYTNLTITPVTIGTPVPDPANANKQIYDLSYNLTIPFTDWNAATNIEHWIILYTNCDLDATISTGWIGSFNPNYIVVDVCDKIDFVFMNAEGSGKIVYFHGADEQVQFGSSCYPNLTPSVRPHEHEIQWKLPGDPIHGAFTTIPFDNPYSCSPSQNSNLPVVLTMGHIMPVTGNLTFRYRNVKRSGSNGCTSSQVCVGPWSDEIVINVQ